jgi:glycine/D-amino acid oxidase-like deaminating enzyme
MWRSSAEGFTGLSAARALAKSGINVAVLEAETIGWGASSRNGGMTLTGLKPSMQSVIKKYGRDLAKRLFQVSLDSVDTVEQVIKEESIDCGFKRYGHLYVASKPHHFDSFYDEVDFMSKEFNHKVHVVPPNELKDEIGSTKYFGGIVDEVSGGLNPAQYVAGLARAAEKAGASLHARARVTSLLVTTQACRCEEALARLPRCFSGSRRSNLPALGDCFGKTKSASQRHVPRLSSYRGKGQHRP